LRYFDKLGVSLFLIGRVRCAQSTSFAE